MKAHEQNARELIKQSYAPVERLVKEMKQALDVLDRYQLGETKDVLACVKQAHKHLTEARYHAGEIKALQAAIVTAVNAALYDRYNTAPQEETEEHDYEPIEDE